LRRHLLFAYYYFLPQAFFYCLLRFLFRHLFFPALNAAMLIDVTIHRAAHCFRLCRCAGYGDIVLSDISVDLVHSFVVVFDHSIR